MVGKRFGKKKIQWEIWCVGKRFVLTQKNRDTVTGGSVLASDAQPSASATNFQDKVAQLGSVTLEYTVQKFFRHRHRTEIFLSQTESSMEAAHCLTIMF